MTGEGILPLNQYIPTLYQIVYINYIIIYSTIIYCFQERVKIYTFSLELF